MEKKGRRSKKGGGLCGASEPRACMCIPMKDVSLGEYSALKNGDKLISALPPSAGLSPPIGMTLLTGEEATMPTPMKGTTSLCGPTLPTASPTAGGGTLRWNIKEVEIVPLYSLSFYPVLSPLQGNTPRRLDSTHKLLFLRAS